MTLNDWIETNREDGAGAGSKIYLKEIDGYRVVIQAGLISGLWWIIINDRPVAIPFQQLPQAMAECERILVSGQQQ
jgi:hypothetical protein